MGTDPGPLGIHPHVVVKAQAPPALAFNPRSEEASTKPTLRQPRRSARCLIPAEGWHEWRDAVDEATGEVLMNKPPDRTSSYGRSIGFTHYNRRSSHSQACTATAAIAKMQWLAPRSSRRPHTDRSSGCMTGCLVSCPRRYGMHDWVRNRWHLKR